LPFLEIRFQSFPLISHSAQPDNMLRQTGACNPRTVSTLILHGDADRILPPEASSRRQAKMVKNARFAEPKGGGPHGVLWAHAEQINSELVKFLA
jgi:pimeloyl-ACP methyl ester carboxylesterase